jgi:hypothetical protein
MNVHVQAVCINVIVPVQVHVCVDVDWCMCESVTQPLMRYPKARAFF